MDFSTTGGFLSRKSADTSHDGNARAGMGVAMLLMISGVGLFGTLSGLIASTLLGTKQEATSNDEVLAELKCLRMEIARLRKENDRDGPLGG